MPPNLPPFPELPVTLASSRGIACHHRGHGRRDMAARSARTADQFSQHVQPVCCRDGWGLPLQDVVFWLGDWVEPGRAGLRRDFSCAFERPAIMGSLQSIRHMGQDDGSDPMGTRGAREYTMVRGVACWRSFGRMERRPVLYGIQRDIEGLRAYGRLSVGHGPMRDARGFGGWDSLDEVDSATADPHHRPCPAEAGTRSDGRFPSAVTLLGPRQLAVVVRLPFGPHGDLHGACREHRRVST